MAGLDIDRRDHSVLGDLSRDLPGARLFTRFDVLARDESEQANGLAGHLARRAVLRCREHRLGVVDQSGNECVSRNPVGPLDDGLGALVSGRRQRHRAGLGNDATHLADRRDELGDSVLGGHRVIEDRRIKGPTALSPQHAGRSDDFAHRVKDPVRSIRFAKASAPIGEVGEVKALVIEGETAGHLPVDARAQLTDRVAVREPLQCLEHHHGADQDSGNRRATPP